MFSKELKDIENIKSKLDIKIQSLESKLSDKIDFEFGIEYLQGDGFCILNIGNADLAPIRQCLMAIKLTGELSESSHKKLCI